jgi:Uncharacterized coiled-coil protein (DUF2353)
LGSSGNGGLVVSQKQGKKYSLLPEQTFSIILIYISVQQLFLQNGGNLPQTPAAQSDLHSLYLALLEALNDKNVALAHQKKTNRFV